MGFVSMGKGGRGARRTADSSGCATRGRGGGVDAAVAEPHRAAAVAGLARDYFYGHHSPMSILTLSLAEAKARLSELTERVTHGDEVVITRHGKPVARIQQVREKARRVDVAAFRRVTAAQAEQAPASVLIRQLRDDARF